MSEQEMMWKALEVIDICEHELIDNWAEFTGTMSCKYCSLFICKSDTVKFKAVLAELRAQNDLESS